MIFNLAIIYPMKNTLNKIIIPKKWSISLSSSKSKEEILKNLNDISSEDINNIWEAIKESKDKDINSESSIQESNIEESTNKESNKKTWEKNSKECSEEHALIVREFFLRMGYTVLNQDTIWIDWKPLFILKKWNELFISHDYDILSWNISWVFPLKDTNDDTIKTAIEVWWKPALVVKIGYEDIILWGIDKIDAWIFFRNQHEQGSYTVQQISEFLNGLIRY